MSIKYSKMSWAMIKYHSTIETDMVINDLRGTLLQMSYSELIDSFMAYAEQDENFANAFHHFVMQKMKTGGEDDARKAVDHSFGAIRFSGRRSNYYGSMDWYSIMNEKDILFQDAEHALEFGNLRRAVAYPLQWLKRFNEVFTEDAFDYDDEGVKLEWACDEAVKFIEKVMYNAEADSQLKIDVCKELLTLSDKSSVFENYNFADVKTFAHRMQALTESPEDALATIEGLLEKDKHTESTNSLILQKFNILSAIGRENEALDFLENNISKDEICTYLVDTLIDKKDYERALSVLEKALKLDERFLKSRWQRKEIEIYQTLGNRQQVIATNRRLFIESRGSLEIYKALKSMIPADEWKGYLLDLMNETRFNDYCLWENGNTKAEIFLAEKDIDSLFQYMMQIDDDLLDLYSRYSTNLSPEQQTKLIPKYVEEMI